MKSYRKLRLQIGRRRVMNYDAAADPDGLRPLANRQRQRRGKEHTMRKLTLCTDDRIRESLTNLTYSGRFTVTDMIDAAEDSTDGAQLLNRLRALGLTDRMAVARETETYTRISIIDCWGNVHYLEARKD